MKLRPFGKTGMQASEIGLGTWQLANPDWGVSDKNEALEIVQKSLEAGCTFFDTAPGYGGGRSEELLGEGLKSVRKDVVICTKFGHTAEGRSDFSADAIRPSLESSMKRLQTDYLDIVLMHRGSFVSMVCRWIGAKNWNWFWIPPKATPRKCSSMPFIRRLCPPIKKPRIAAWA